MLKRFFGCISCRFVNKPHPGDLGLSDSTKFAILGSPQSGDTGDLGLSDSSSFAFRFIRATLVLWDMVDGGGIAVRDGIAQYGTK